ncbi:hypothetical protein BMETH_948_0 [methanotrophic bacterial endosymbiont of Bathymodiolus sp.]|nr:hypothetical protein BMETH_948_0 [methanotrophic bacterial endosymbiont of Bathymodiolus sp.]
MSVQPPIPLTLYYSLRLAPFLKLRFPMLISWHERVEHSRHSYLTINTPLNPLLVV